MRARLLILVVVMAGFAAVADSVSAAGSDSQPLAVQTASLAQSVRRLTWKVSLQTPFAPSALAADGRSLCLLIERPANGSVAGQLCVVGPRAGGKTARLAYQHITRAGPGRPTVIAATVSRDGARDLTASFLPAAIGNAYRSLRWQVMSTLKSPRCQSPKATRTGCFKLFPAKPTLARVHTPQLVGCVPSGPAFVNQGRGVGREVALTFDDGPWYDTPQFLDILERYKVPGTFFEIGEQISTYGEGGAVERRMLADGDMIGDHTWSHPNVSGGGVFARNQILAAAGAIERATRGFRPCLFRAPYGAVSSALIGEARSLGFTTIQWDVDPTDWARPGTAAIYDRVVSGAHPGAIILQHDGGGDRSETLAALPHEISTLRSRGYRFVTVTQLLGQRLIYR